MGEVMRVSALTTTHPHPEWKRLVANLEPLLNVKSEFSYSELAELAGVDVQTTRGRSQLIRASREILQRWDKHLEVVRCKGYRVVDAAEHGICASRRVRKARRQLQTAKRIVEHTDLSSLSVSQKSQNLLLGAALGSILQSVKSVDRNVKKLAAYIQQAELPSAEQVERTVQALTKLSIPNPKLLRKVV